MWLWLIAVFSLILIWVGGFLLEFMGTGVPLLARILLSVGVVAFVIGVIVYRRWRALNSARKLEQEILKQAEQHAMNARPDRRAEILELQLQVQRGIASLKQSKLSVGRSGGALYALPWYVIIGPPGAGKTTALKHSGLIFPFLDPRGGGVRGVGGTRNCDWWFTNEAILLDTAGRYATGQDDHEEWIAFLGFLKRFRSRKPINGVIVAISVADLIDAAEEQVEEFAKTLRGRVDEVMTRLQMVVPVYVMFSKADLIGGFVEFWGDLRRSERAQIWGATVRLSTAETTHAAEAFRTEYEALLKALEARALRRLAIERRLDVRQKIFQFPLEVKGLSRNLEEFIGALFQKNNFQETPIFRGFYFSSGTQEGRPMARVISGMARAFGLQAEVTPVDEQPQESKSYFVTDLFRRVVFPDQNIAGRTSSELRRQWINRIVFALLALAVALMIGIPSSCTYVRNRALDNNVVRVANDAHDKNETWAHPVGPGLEALASARDQLVQLGDWRTNGAPVGMRWGMYVGDDLYQPLRDVYAGILRGRVDDPSLAILSSNLEATNATGAPSADLYNRQFNDLKLYLMMTDPSHLDVEWAVPHLAHLWSQVLRVASSQDVADTVMEPHAQTFLDLLKRGEIAPRVQDGAYVTRARSILLQIPRIDRMYESLVRDANSQILPIRRETIFYGSAAAFISSRKNAKVDGAYTKAGWAKVRVLLGAERSKLAGDQWVLGDAQQKASEEVEREVGKLRDLYFERYKAAWRDFIGDLDVQKPDSASTSLDELSALSEPEWPYLRLIRSLEENTTLEVTREELGLEPPSLLQQGNALANTLKRDIKAIEGLKTGAIPDGGAPPEHLASPVERAFKPIVKFGMPAGPVAPGASPPPTGLSQYQAILGKLVGILSDLRDSKPAPDAKATTTEFEQAFRSVNTLLVEQDGFTRPLVTTLLKNPITFAWASVVNDAGGAASGLWELNVWQKWHTALEGKYPFAESSQDATIADVAEFFKPQAGLLWAFYEQNLKGALDRNGTSFVPTRRFKAQMGFTDVFLGTCLHRGAEITQTIFPPKAEAPMVEFEVNLHSVSDQISEVTLTIDGMSFIYKNAPEEWQTAQWPGKDGKDHGASIHVHGMGDFDEQISRVGDFGLFRLLDAAAKIAPGTAGGKPQGAPTLVSTWELRTHKAFVKLDFRPKRTDHPLTRSYFQGYLCPRVIAVNEN